MSPDVPLATYAVADGVPRMTLRRPHARNVVNAQLSLDVCRGLEQADADRAVRAVVVTGDGPAYCAAASCPSPLGSPTRGLVRVRGDGRTASRTEVSVSTRRRRWS